MNDGNFGGATAESFAEPSDADGMGERARQTAENVLNDLKSQAAEYLELGRGKATELTDSMEDQIRSRPVAAVAVAAGLGFALGLLWTRRS